MKQPQLRLNQSIPTIKAAGEPTAPQKVVKHARNRSTLVVLLIAGLVLFMGVLLPKIK